MIANVTSCQSANNHIGNVFLQIVLIIEMIVGLPGSMVALWVFCFRIKRWKSHIIFLFNMLLADFLLLLSVPFRIDTHLRGDLDHWAYGPIWCRINLFMLTVNRSASIAFMTVVAMDRYFKVVYPHHCISRLTVNQTSLLSGLIWTAVVAVRIPLLTINLLHQDPNCNISLCRSFHSYKEIPGPVLVHYIAYIAEFFLPWCLLIFCSVGITCHLRKRRMDRHKKVRRAIRAVMVITLVFTICFMPSVFTGTVGWQIKIFYPEMEASYKLWTHAFMVCIGFTYLNSALDPVIYVFSSSNFYNALITSFRFKRIVREAKSP